MRLMSRRRYSMKAANRRDASPIVTMSGPGRDRRGVGREQHLEAQHRVERDIQQQPRQHGRDRRRALGMRIRQPGVQRRQADLGAVSQQEEDEGGVEKRRIEARDPVHQQRPHHGVDTAAHHRLRREIDQDGAEQGERDADAGQDEVLPGRLDASCVR